MAEPSPSYETFRSRLDQPFSMRLTDDRVIELVLTGCVPGQAVPHQEVIHQKVEPHSFSLTFKAGADAPIEQATFLLSADGFGPSPIFLVPLRQLPDGLEYQAVFTTSKDESAS
ncbi:MAG: DUF6916 family protein [Jatrophihabitans sp.]